MFRTGDLSHVIDALVVLSKATIWTDWLTVSYKENKYDEELNLSRFSIRLDWIFFKTLKMVVFIQKSWVNKYPTLSIVSTVDLWRPTHDWCLTLLRCCSSFLFRVAMNCRGTGQLFLIYLHRQILACWAVLHSLAKARVLIIDTRHILGSLWALSRHPVCFVWGGGWGSLWSTRFGHAN